jgi:hypothetical protein
MATATPSLEGGEVGLFHLVSPSMRGAEVDVLALFFIWLYSFRVRREGDDKHWRAPSNKGVFNVSSFYSVLV